MAAESRSKPQVRGGALDALRFVAAAFVVLFHYGQDAPTPLADVHEMFGRGYLATDFFLLLSGFVLARSYGSAVAGCGFRLGPFMARRIARIYPGHFLTLAGMVIIVLAAAAAGVQPGHPANFDWRALPANLLLVHAWGYGGGTWNIPTWTLSALVACYLAFPWLWRAVSRLRHPAWCAAVFLAVILATDAASVGLLHREAFDLPYAFGLVRAFPLFIGGLLLARLCQTADLSWRASLAIGAAGVLAFALDALALAPDILRIFATAAIIVGCGQAVRKPSAVLEWGGQLSFSLFVTHAVSGMIWFHIFGPALNSTLDGAAGDWIVWAGSLPFALVAAAAFHHLIDEPIQRVVGPWARRLGEPRPTMISADAAAASRSA